MKQAAQLGFDGIELCIASQGVLTQKTTQAECETFCEEAQKNGIEISGVASGESWGRSPTSNDPEVRQSIIDFTKKALQITKWLGTDAYLFVPGAVDVFFLPDEEVVPYDVCYQRATDSIFQIAPTDRKSTRLNSSHT